MSPGENFTIRQPELELTLLHKHYDSDITRYDKAGQWST